MLASLVSRLAITLGGFFLVAGGRWERLVVAVLGFVGARAIMARRFGPRQGSLRSGAKGGTKP